jgi:hypothetical protein
MEEFSMSWYYLLIAKAKEGTEKVGRLDEKRKIAKAKKEKREKKMEDEENDDIWF